MRPSFSFKIVIFGIRCKWIYYLRIRSWQDFFSRVITIKTSYEWLYALLNNNSRLPVDDFCISRIATHKNLKIFANPFLAIAFAAAMIFWKPSNLSRITDPSLNCARADIFSHAKYISVKYAGSDTHLSSNKNSVLEISNRLFYRWKIDLTYSCKVNTFGLVFSSLTTISPRREEEYICIRLNSKGLIFSHLRACPLQGRLKWGRPKGLRIYV